MKIKKSTKALQEEIDKLEKEKQELNLKLSAAKEKLSSQVPEKETSTQAVQNNSKPNSSYQFYSREIVNGKIKETIIKNGHKEEITREINEKDVNQLLAEHDHALNTILQKLEKMENITTTPFFPFGFGFFS